MAKTARKPRKKVAKKKTKTTRRGVKRVKSVQELCTTELEMNGSRLVVKLSRGEHPEIFDLEHLAKQMRQVTQAYKRKRKMRDVVDFLAETEKSLQILLKNHLQDAMRIYFR